MAKFVIKKIPDVEDHELTDLKVDDYLNIIKENRNRIRSLAAMLLTICGMLLSANFIISLFIIKQQSNIFTYAVIVILTIAIAFVILSINISTLAATITKAQKLNRQLFLIYEGTTSCNFGNNISVHENIWIHLIDIRLSFLNDVICPESAHNA